MSTPNKIQRLPTATFARWAGAASMLTFMLIVLGGTVRVFEAGLSCPDWPTCYGHWWPFPVDPATGFSNFQVFLEWVHRLVASITGGLTLMLTLWAYRLRPLHHRLFPLMIVALGVLALQIKLGGLTVLLQNVHWSVAIHLGNALIFYALLLAVTMQASRPWATRPLAVSRRYRWLLVWLTATVFLTVLMGAMVAKSYAGGVCGGLFSCLGSWVPFIDAAQMLHMKHRALATTVLLLAGLLFAFRRYESPSIQKSARGILAVVLAQLLLGTVLVYSFAYYPGYYRFLSAFHLAMATVVFTFCVAHWGKLWWGEKLPQVRVMPFHA